MPFPIPGTWPGWAQITRHYTSGELCDAGSSKPQPSRVDPRTGTKAMNLNDSRLKTKIRSPILRVGGEGVQPILGGIFQFDSNVGFLFSTLPTVRSHLRQNVSRGLTLRACVCV